MQRRLRPVVCLRDRTKPREALLQVRTVWGKFFHILAAHVLRGMLILVHSAAWRVQVLEVGEQVHTVLKPAVGTSDFARVGSSPRRAARAEPCIPKEHIDDVPREFGGHGHYLPPQVLKHHPVLRT